MHAFPCSEAEDCKVGDLGISVKSYIGFTYESPEHQALGISNLFQAKSRRMVSAFSVKFIDYYMKNITRV